MSSSSQASPANKTPFDNNGQYSRDSILRYEKIFGEHYISTGGAETTDRLCSMLGKTLRPGIRVLDVGSGIGGAAFHLAKRYGAKVTGIDLAEEMVAIGLDRARQVGLSDDIQFVLGDVLETSFPTKFDLIWSRDALMHVPDKPKLFSRLFSLLDPGGRVVITDYARGRTPASPAFEEYIRKTGYHVLEPDQYGKLLEDAGFVDVEAHDATAVFLDILSRESKRLVSDRDDFLTVFSEKDLNYLVDRWAMKEDFCRAGDMKWGIFLGTRKS